MPTNFTKAKIQTQNIYDSESDEKNPTVSTRLEPMEVNGKWLTPDEIWKEINKTLAKDGISKSDFLREAIQLRLTYDKSHFGSLLYHSAAVVKKLEELPRPMIIRG